MIGVELEGVAEVAAKFTNLSDRMTQELRISVSRLSIRLQNRVKEEKLTGQILGVRSGRGRRSIHQDVQVSANVISGVVSTNVGYMIGWETGWSGSAKQAAQMTATKARFSSSGSSDRFANGSPRKRAFLIPTLQEMGRSGEVETEFENAAGRAVK